jgi:signal transduction histidine kinase
MNWLRGLSIRTRLTLGTLAVAFVVSLAAGLLLEANVESIVRSTTVQLLRDDAAPIKAAIKASPLSPNLRAGEGQLVLVLSPSNVEELSNLPDALVDEKTKLEALGGKPTIVAHDRREYLVLRRSVHTPEGKWRIIVARSTEPGELVASNLALTFIIGGATLFVLLGLTSWILSGASLRPVGRMRAEAQRLGDATTSGLLPVGPARDELAELAATLNQLIDRNRASVERERQMISDASHELRTPLAVLIAQLEAASDPSTGEAESTERIGQARETASRLSRLATNLLELSSLDSRRSSVESTGAVLAGEFAECIDRARTLAEDRGVLVDFDVRDALPAGKYLIAPGDFGRLVDNLLANAVAASERSGVVRAELEFDNDGLALSILDHGPGMPEDFLAVAFDRFTRPETARARASGGSGLGLAIVAAIVAKADGDVSLANEHPGLRVRVRIPHARPGARR